MIKKSTCLQYFFLILLSKTYLSIEALARNPDSLVTNRLCVKMYLHTTLLHSVLSIRCKTEGKIN